ADNIFERHETPVAAVERRIAIVAHGENGVGRNNYFAVDHMVLQHVGGARINHGVGLAGEVVAIGIDLIGFVNFVGLVELHAIAVDLFVDDADAVAGDAHGALHEGHADVDGVAEHNNVAALDVAVGQQVFANRSAGREGHFVHQQVVADEQRVFHGTRWNHVGLHQRRGQEQQQQDGDGPLGNGSSGRLD